jgi:hypothetical protein
MDHDLRFTRATRRRNPLPVLATVGLVLVLAIGFLFDVGRARPGRLAEPAAQVT